MDHNALVDLYFTITAAAVIVLAVLLAVIFIYIIGILNAIRRIVRTAEFATEMLKDDVVELRRSIKAHGLTIAALGRFFRHLFSKRKK